MKRPALWIAAALAATTLTAPPAQAYPTATVTVDVSDAYLPIGECRYHDYSVTITPNADTRSWSADVTVEGPHGEYVASDYFYGYGASYETGSIFLCGSTDDPGLYSIDVDLELSDRNYDSWPGLTDLEFFDVRKQRPALVIALSDRTPRKGQVVNIRVRGWGKVTREPVSYGDIVIQRRAGGRWRNLTWSNTTLDSRGRTTLRGRAQQIITLRARLKGDNAYTAATSRPVTMRVGR